MDIDFDDNDAPKKAPATKALKFAPKNSKFKPVGKPKIEPDASIPSSNSNTVGKPKIEPYASIPSSNSNPVAVPKVEIDDSPPPPPIEQPSPTVLTSHDANGGAINGTDGTEMEIDRDLEQDGEDKVVREIDVFFTSSVDANSKLYVLQYPLRPCWRPYELDDRCSEVRVKQETAEVEIDMSVQAESENYDTDADYEKTMRKQVLSTKWTPPVANGFAVGILVRNELHLNPVNAVVQLRSSMQHLKRQNTPLDEETVKNEKTTKQAKKQGKQPGAVTEENTDAKEKWISLKYHGERSLLSHRYMENMVARQDSHIQFSMNQSDYIDSLCPATRDKPRPKGSSRRSLLKLPLAERFKRYLLEGPSVNRFIILKHLAPDASDEEIFKVLKEHAQLVQGLWVAKSRLKLQTDGGKDVLFRNFVMLHFSKNPILKETQLPNQFTFNNQWIRILNEFAQSRVLKDWKFKECPDEMFIKTYPDIVKEQKEQWDTVESSIMDNLFRKSKPNFAVRRPLASSNTNAVPSRPAIAPSSKPPLSDETREVLPKALQKLFQAYKVCSMSQIRQRLRDMAVSENTQRKGSREAKAAAAAAEAPQEELQRIVSEVAVDIHGTFVLKSSPDHPQYDALRKIVINLFIAQGPGGKLKKANIFAAAEMALKRQITNAEYQKVLGELCISQNALWVLKSGDSPT